MSLTVLSVSDFIHSTNEFGVLFSTQCKVLVRLKRINEELLETFTLECSFTKSFSNAL